MKRCLFSLAVFYGRVSFWLLVYIVRGVFSIGVVFFCMSCKWLQDVEGFCGFDKKVGNCKKYSTKAIPDNILRGMLFL